MKQKFIDPFVGNEIIFLFHCFSERYLEVDSSGKLLCASENPSEITKFVVEKSENGNARLKFLYGNYFYYKRDKEFSCDNAIGTDLQFELVVDRSNFIRIKPKEHNWYFGLSNFGLFDCMDKDSELCIWRYNITHKTCD